MANIDFYLFIYFFNLFFFFSAKKKKKNKIHLCSKNINVFENTFATTVNEFVINKLIKLTTL